MNPSNFTPISSSRRKKSSFYTKIVGLFMVLVLVIGVAAGFVAVTTGFNFQSRAATAKKNLTKYGWDGRCFTKLTGIKTAAVYQCPGKFSPATAKGCQPGNNSGGKRRGYWTAKDKNLTTNGKSNVCISSNGFSTPKDSKGCFTQQLDIDDGSGGGPEGFYSFDKCTPTTPTPTFTPTPTGTLTPTPTPTNTPTPTPTGVCPVPAKPKVHIDCPFCNERNTLIQTTTSPTEEPIVCAQVVVSAKNPATGECREFGSPCTIAKGWVEVDSCAITPTLVPSN